MNRVNPFEAVSQDRFKYGEIYAGKCKSLFGHYFAYEYYPFLLSFALINSGLAYYYCRFISVFYYNFSLTALTIIFHVLTDLTMLYTIIGDPGIIPRLNYAHQKYDEQYLIPRQLQKRKKQTTFIIVNTKDIFEYRYCEFCHVYKPNRSGHCRRCDNCVQDFDHHCRWLGGCIGRRNYHAFILFINSLNSLLLITLLQLIIALIDDIQVEIVLIGIFNFAFATFLISLCFYHFYLIVKNLTTIEHMKTDRFISEQYESYKSKNSWKQVRESVWERVGHPIRPPLMGLEDTVLMEEPFEIKRMNAQLRQMEEKKQKFRKVVEIQSITELQTPPKSEINVFRVNIQERMDIEINSQLQIPEQAVEQEQE